MAIVFCTDFGGWGEPTLKLLLKIHQHLCNRTTYDCFVCFSTKYKSLSSKSTFILRKVVENYCDMAYQKYCKSSFRKKFVYISLPCPFNRTTASNLGALRTPLLLNEMFIGYYLNCERSRLPVGRSERIAS